MKKLNERKVTLQNIKKIIIETLELDIDPELITNDQPLIGRGLEIDSIDVMQLSLALEDFFEVEFDDETVHVFGSVNKIADYIIKEQKNDK